MADDPSFFEVVTTTRAIRRYRPDPVPDEDLARILFAASRAPSGSNRQPFRFLVLRDGPRARAARRVLGESFRELWAAKRAADGYDRRPLAELVYEDEWGASPSWAVDPPGTAHTRAGPPGRSGSGAAAEDR